jgi:hypothetical protein
MLCFCLFWEVLAGLILVTWTSASEFGYCKNAGVFVILSCTEVTGCKARPERDADNSLPSNAEVKKDLGYTSSPPQAPLWRAAGQIYSFIYNFVCRTLHQTCIDKSDETCVPICWAEDETNEMLFRDVFLHRVKPKRRIREGRLEGGMKGRR